MGSHTSPSQKMQVFKVKENSSTKLSPMNKFIARFDGSSTQSSNYEVRDQHDIHNLQTNMQLLSSKSGQILKVQPSTMPNKNLGVGSPTSQDKANKNHL